MIGLSRFSAASSLFRPRSGRVSGQTQQAANRANDSGSMTLDEGEARRNLQRQALARRGLSSQIAQARDVGDFETMRTLQGQLQELTFGVQDDVRALNPRGITAERLEAGRDNLIGQFPEAALGAAGAARADADRIGGQIDTYNQRLGEGRLRAMGYDAAGERNRSVTGLDDTQIGPAAMSRFGSMVSPTERATVDPTLAGGVDVREGLMDRRRAALGLATDLEGRAERGLELPPIDSERLAARYAAEDEAARQRAMEAQRRRQVLAGNERRDFDATDTLGDLGVDTTLSMGRTAATDARTGETVAGTQEFLASEKGRTTRDMAMYDRRAALAESERLAQAAEGERDLVDKRGELAGLGMDRDRLDLEVQVATLREALKNAGGVTGSTIVDRNPEAFVTGINDSWRQIADAFAPQGDTGSAAGNAKFSDIPTAQIDLFHSHVEELERAYAEGSPEVRQAVQDIAWKIKTEAVAISGSTGTGQFQAERADTFIGRGLDSLKQSILGRGDQPSSVPLTADQMVAAKKIAILQDDLNLLQLIADGKATPKQAQAMARQRTAQNNAGL